LLPTGLPVFFPPPPLFPTAAFLLRLCWTCAFSLHQRHLPVGRLSFFSRRQRSPLSSLFSLDPVPSQNRQLFPSLFADQIKRSTAPYVEAFPSPFFLIFPLSSENCLLSLTLNAVFFLASSCDHSHCSFPNVFSILDPLAPRYPPFSFRLYPRQQTSSPQSNLPYVIPPNPSFGTLFRETVFSRSHPGAGFFQGLPSPHGLEEAIPTLFSRGGQLLHVLLPSPQEVRRPPFPPSRHFSPSHRLFPP